jgi:hypothetical protein
MELLTPVVALIALALLSLRYGRDSRDWRPGQGLVGWAADRPRPAHLLPHRPRRPSLLPRRIALWSGLALVRCGQALLALAAPPPNVAALE